MNIDLDEVIIMMTEYFISDNEDQRKENINNLLSELPIV